MFRFKNKRVNSVVVLLSGLLIIAGCTSSDSLVQSVRPLYQTQGEASTANTKSSYALGKQYFSERHYGLALEAFQAELRVNQQSVRALNGIAACYDQLKRYDLALSYYYKALQIQPDSAQTLGNLGYSYLLQERYEEAERMLRLALHHDPDHVSARQHLATLAKVAPSVAELAPSEPLPSRPVESTATELPLSQAEVAESERRVTAIGAKAESVAVAESAAASETAGPAEIEMAATTESEEVVVAEREAEGKGVFQSIGGLFKRMGARVWSLFGPAEEVEPAVAVAASAPVEKAAHEVVVERVPDPVLAEPAVAAAAVDSQVEEVASVPVENESIQPSQEPEIVEPQVEEVASVPVENESIQPSQEPEIVESQVEEVASVPVENESIQPSQELAAVELKEGQEMMAEPVSSQPAEPSAVPAQAPVSISGMEKIEVSNGNGIPGNANLFAIYLKKEGEQIWRITNADNFSYVRSIIFYRPGNRLTAERLANKLPVGVTLEETERNYPGIAARLILGEEMVPYRSAIEKALREYERQRLYARNYSFGSDAAVAIEVSNGNGSEGIARLLRGILIKKGQLVTRVTNAERFDHARTVIYYQPGELHSASQVAAELPVESRLEEADIRSRNVKVRIIMGRDFIHFKADMERLADKDA